MSAALRIFLDTTIQIERVTATRARQAEIGRALAGAQVISSTYVLGEFPASAEIRPERKWN